MNGANARTSQHGKCSLGDHRQVNQNPVPLLHTQLFQHGRHALHLGVQLAKGVNLFLLGLGGNVNQRRLLGPVFQMPVHRVVAQIGGAAHEPLGKRRIAVVANLLRLGFPIDQSGLFGPEGIRLSEGAAIEVGIAGHYFSPVGSVN